MRGHSEFFQIELVLIAIGGYLWMQGNEAGMWLFLGGVFLYAVLHGHL